METSAGIHSAAVVGFAAPFYPSYPHACLPQQVCVRVCTRRVLDHCLQCQDPGCLILAGPFPPFSPLEPLSALLADVRKESC